MVTKHFLGGLKLYKILNRNRVKVSYSCMDNISKIIKTVIIKKSHRNQVTKHHNAIAEKKENVQWNGTVKLMM